MGYVEFDREPPANLTTMVMAFGGWIDAGQAATGALRHLVRDLSATRLAWIDPEHFFVFTQERPTVRLGAVTSSGHGASSLRGMQQMTATVYSYFAARSHMRSGRPIRGYSLMWLSAVG